MKTQLIFLHLTKNIRSSVQNDTVFLGQQKTFKVFQTLKVSPDTVSRICLRPLHLLKLFGKRPERWQ
jgi:hypothetical protein